MISAVVLTKNNAATLSFTLKSISWCDEVIIVDDESEDMTLDIAKKYTTKVFSHALKNNFSQQRNYACSKAKYEWILFVDADEVISEGLKNEIARSIQDKTSQIDGYYIQRSDFFLGRWLNYGETQHVRLLRLARKDKGVWIHSVHEVWQIPGKTSTLVNPLIHLSHSSISEFLKKINRYSTLKAQENYRNKNIIEPLTVITYPVGKFFSNFIVKKGFMDAEQGLIMALMMSFHSFLVRAKTYLLQQSKTL